MTDYGKTWWGSRWWRGLEKLGLSYPDNRIVKGRALANRGAVSDLLIEPGEVNAWVDVPKAAFGVTVRVPAWDADAWQAAGQRFAVSPRDTAALLSGELPRHVDTTLADLDMAVFPRDGELSVYCPCTDRDPACTHVIAVQLVTAARADADASTLLRLRGCDTDRLVSGLSAARRVAPQAGIRPAELPVAEFYAARATLP